jgi:hypothetical protein
MTGSDGEVSRRLRRDFSATSDRRHCRGSVGNGGAPSRPGHTSVGLQSIQEGEGRSDDVLEGAENGVSSNAHKVCPLEVLIHVLPW